MIHKIQFGANRSILSIYIDIYVRDSIHLQFTRWNNIN